MWYAMREALALVAEEGLEKMWERHLEGHRMLWEGLTELGLEPFVEDPKDRLITVNTIKVGSGQAWEGGAGSGPRGVVWGRWVCQRGGHHQFCLISSWSA